MSAFLLLPASLSVPARPATPEARKPIPFALRAALELLRSLDIIVVEVGPALGYLHYSSVRRCDTLRMLMLQVYVYLVPNASFRKTTDLLQDLGFLQLPSPISAFKASDPALVVYPRSITFLDDSHLQFNVERGAHHPSLVAAVSCYINILCRTPYKSAMLKYVCDWLFCLVEHIKGEEVFDDDRP